MKNEILNLVTFAALCHKNIGDSRPECLIYFFKNLGSIYKIFLFCSVSKICIAICISLVWWIIVFSIFWYMRKWILESLQRSLFSEQHDSLFPVKHQGQHVCTTRVKRRNKSHFWCFSSRCVINVSFKLPHLLALTWAQPIVGFRLDLLSQWVSNQNCHEI